MMTEQTQTPASAQDLGFARELQRQLYHLVRAIEICDRICVSEHEVTVAQSYALLALPARGSMTMHELSSAMDLAGSTMTRVVDQLVYKGLAERAPDDEDRRIVRVTLSDHGRDVRAEIEGGFAALFARVAGRVEEEDREPFLRALGEIHNGFSQRGC